MKRILLIAVVICTVNSASLIFAKDFLSKEDKLAAVIVKLKNDNRALQEYAALGRAQCYSSLLNLEEKKDDGIFVFEGKKYKNPNYEFIGSNLFSNAYYAVQRTGSPFLNLIQSTALKDSLEVYIKTWQDSQDTYRSHDAKSYSNIYKYTETCEKGFNFNKETLRQSYLKLISNAENYVKPIAGLPKNTKKDIEQSYDEYLKYYIKPKMTDGCPLGRADLC